MNKVVEGVWALLREPEGPLVPYLDSFAKSLEEQGFKQRVIGQKLRVAASFSKWLQDEGVAAQDVTDAHVERFFACPARGRSIQRGEFAALRRLMGLLGQWGVVCPLTEHGEATPIQQAVGAFADYLRHERALSDQTLTQYCPFIERFLPERFGHGPVEFAALHAEDVIGFVTRQAAHLSPARAKAATKALRSFFR